MKNRNPSRKIFVRGKDPGKNFPKGEPAGKKISKPKDGKAPRPGPGGGALTNDKVQRLAGKATIAKGGKVKKSGSI